MGHRTRGRGQGQHRPKASFNSAYSGTVPGHLLLSPALRRAEHKSSPIPNNPAPRGSRVGRDVSGLGLGILLTELLSHTGLVLLWPVPAQGRAGHRWVRTGMGGNAPKPSQNSEAVASAGA